MSRKKIKIALFHLAFVYSGGGERLVLKEAQELTRLGYDVTCFAPVINKKNCFPELMEDVKVEKILPKFLPSWFPDIALLSILAACLLTPFFFFKFRKYDLYFGANQPGPWIAYILSKLNKKPYAIYLAQPTRIIHPRLVDQQVGLKINDGFSLLNFVSFCLKPFIYLADVKSIRGANLVFSNGSYMTGVLKDIYRINPINCPAGADASRVLSVVDRKHKFHGKILLNGKMIQKPYALVTNRHFAQKKFEYAIDAIEMLATDIQLVIAGEATEYTRRLQKKYSTKKNIHFVGLLSESLLDKAYAHAAVYLYPAPEEDFGMGIIEAMAHGTPVVAWGNAGPTGIITHGKNGFLAKPFDVGDFSKHIERLLESKALYQKTVQKAYENIEATFTYEHHGEILSTKMRKNLVQWNMKRKAASLMRYKPKMLLIALPKWGRTHAS